VTVESVPLPDWASGVLAEAAGRADVLVLPRAVRDGRGEYRSTDLPVVKALRAAGVDADWAHQGPERTFVSEYGVKEDALVIALFVTQALGEESVVKSPGGCWPVSARCLLDGRRARMVARLSLSWSG
jgi:hypothetical protein